MHSARMLRSVGKYNTDCPILSWNLSTGLPIGVHVESEDKEAIDLHAHAYLYRALVPLQYMYRYS